MISIGFLIYLNDEDRLKKRKLFKRFFLDDLIEICLKDLDNDFLGLIIDKISHIDKIIFYSITDLPEIFDEVIEIIDCLSNSKIEIHFILENMSIDETNAYTIIKMLKCARTFKKNKSSIRNNKENINEVIKLYLEEGKYSIEKIAEITGLSPSSIYLRRSKLLKNKAADSSSRKILTLKQES